MKYSVSHNDHFNQSRILLLASGPKAIYAMTLSTEKI